MRPPQFNRGDRVWTSPAPLNCGRYDIGTVERDNGFSVTVKWDKAGRLAHEDWPNHPIKPIRRVMKEAAHV